MTHSTLLVRWNKHSLRVPEPLALRMKSLLDTCREVDPNQLICEVLRLGLDEVEKATSRTSAGQPEFCTDSSQPVYLLTGPFSEFHGISHRPRRTLDHAPYAEDAESGGTADQYSLGFSE